MNSISNKISSLDGLTFDDVLLIPNKSNISSRRDVDTKTRLTNKLEINIPIISANMDTVTESEMAIAMAREGGMGVVHRFMSIVQQVNEVNRVKRSESIIIEKPYTLTINATLKDAKYLMEEREVGGILVLNDSGKLAGILTHRDVLFQDNLNTAVKELMTRDIITANEGISIDDAKRILHKNRIEKLPIVDDYGNLKGLITSKDISKMERFPKAAKDKKGRLLVGAAVGVKDDYLERTRALIDAEIDVIVIDVAHGHSEYCINAIKKIRKEFGNMELIAGNVATKEGTEELISAGANGVKVGVGAASICLTRIVSGSGVPQLTSILDCSEIAEKYDVPLISDGGIKHAGDITKAIAAGASSVMIGSLLAGTEESPGKAIIKNGRKYKIYRGSTSFDATISRKEKENFSDIDNFISEIVPEGVESTVPYKGKVSEIIHQLIGGLRSGMSYCGASTINELMKKSKFIKITSATLRESHPHDVNVIK